MARSGRLLGAPTLIALVGLALITTAAWRIWSMDWALLVSGVLIFTVAIAGALRARHG